MKEFLRPIYNHPGIIKMRNLLGIKPVLFKDLDGAYAGSDLFIWRTDGDFSTIFRASDIAYSYYKKKSRLKLVFFDANGELIKDAEIPFSQEVIDFKISKKFLGIEGFGSFLAFNLIDETTDLPQITNRCYVGYSLDKDDPSFVHGNVISKYVSQGTKGPDLDLGNKFFEHNMSTQYLIQKDFSLLEKSELFFTNPLEKEIIISANEKSLSIKPMETVKMSINECELIKVKSNFGFPRPVVFSYRESFFDVHHA
tara:strand:+ start:6978 stop:7739 length:762 start_codon:yes stop_codon:yes gene_type:complete